MKKIKKYECGGGNCTMIPAKFGCWCRVEDIKKLIDEAIKKNKMQFHTKKCACVPCQKLALVIYWLEKLKAKIDE